MSPCSSAPFRWGRSSCLGLRTGVSPHFSMNSMREILALRGGYERGLLPPSIPMPTGIHWPPATPSHPQPPKWPLPLALHRHLEVTSCRRQDYKEDSLADAAPFTSRTRSFLQGIASLKLKNTGVPDHPHHRHHHRHHNPPLTQ